MDRWRRRCTQTRTPNHTAFLCGTCLLKFSVAPGTLSTPIGEVHSKQCFLPACLGGDGIAQRCPLDMHLLGLQPTTVRRGASAAARPFADDVRRGPGWLSRSRDHESGFEVVAAGFWNSADVSFETPSRPSPQLRWNPPSCRDELSTKGVSRCIFQHQRSPHPKRQPQHPSRRPSERIGCFNPPRFFYTSIPVSMGGVARRTW